LVLLFFGFGFLVFVQQKQKQYLGVREVKEEEEPWGGVGWRGVACV